MSAKTALLFCLLLVFGVSARADGIVTVPAGNRNAEQPAVPGASHRRTEALKTTFDAKYRKIYALLETDQELRGKIIEVAEQYEIDPIHMVGAIVGEHTYNVDAYDRLQAYYVKALAYVTSQFAFEHDGETIGEFITRPEFEPCQEATGSYALWTCRDRIWTTQFRGRTVDDKAWPDDRFSAVFFQPFYAGQTFGLGQINPLTALQMSDLVVEISGLAPLEHGDPQSVYKTIMDPDLSLPYIAATLRKAIDAYGTIAGFDITGNPGITATLYNLGNPDERAQALKQENEERVRDGKRPRLPEENYYGWLVNDRLEELSALF